MADKAQYIEGPIGSGKTSLLVEKTAGLLEEVPSSNLLVLSANHPRQQDFIRRLLLKTRQSIGQMPLYTYAGLVRNTLFDFWPLIEEHLAKTLKTGRPRIRPTLSGMEDTELILRWLLQNNRQAYPAIFADFPGSDDSLVRQLVRRLRLRSENRLSRPEMTRRSKILEERCIAETAEMEKQFDKTSYALRMLDLNKQLDVFHALLESSQESNKVLTGHFRNNLKHLMVDDVDESIPAQQDFIRWLAPSLESLTLAADPDGGTRRGYLNAYPYGWGELKQDLPGNVETLSREDAFYAAGQTLLSNWQSTESFDTLSANIQLHDEALTRAEMLDQVVYDVLAMVADGTSPGELTLVLPKADSLSISQLEQRLTRRGVKVQVLSGTRRPLDNPKCRAYLYLLQFLNSEAWQYRLSSWELKTMLVHLLDLSWLDRESIDNMMSVVIEGQALPQDEEAPALFPLLPEIGRDDERLARLPSWVLERYNMLRDWTAEARDWGFENQLYRSFSDVVSLYADEADRFDDLNRLLASYEKQKELYAGLLELSADTENEPFPYPRWWIRQVKTGAVADSPESPPEPDMDAVIIATPQKIIDFEISRDYQFWLDVSSREWARTDNAPLYNAWIHSAVWDGQSLPHEESDEAIIRSRAGHITRTLMMLAKNAIRAYASDLDDLGFTQQGLLDERLQVEADEADIPVDVPVILRDDQKPVLDYRQGTMAVTAVPGAGKTFINVELIRHLVQSGTPPEKILVLTYMDSAAKTLLSRLKSKLAPVLPSSRSPLPVVSTIHSMAFRILMENDHAVRLGFSPDDVTILDDFESGELLAQVAEATCPESIRNAGKWQQAISRAISHCKSMGLMPADLAEKSGKEKRFRLLEFLPAYTMYEQALKKQGALDFTDLIVKAIELLARYPDIRQIYQNRFDIVIEDEAQDSSKMLQRFISLVGGENPNLIRTGDTNQSITTTFSSADTSVFRNFIGNADKVVEMDHSGRCAQPVIDLANNWITSASQHPVLKNAFQPVAMKAVPGQNPDLLYPIQSLDFDLASEEEAWMIERIAHIKQQQPDASIAVLARNNSQVTHLTGLFHLAGIQAVSLSEQLTLNPVFNVIAAFLKTLLSPTTEEQLALYEALIKANLLSFSDERKETLRDELVFRLPPEKVPDLSDERLIQLYYDWQEFSRLALQGNMNKLIVRMTDRLFSSVSDRSNGYLCALMADEILSDTTGLAHQSPLELLVVRFDALQKSWRGKRGFSELLSRNPEQFVQVMSLHKAKGQEFDVVFMPGLQKDRFPTVPTDVRFEESDKLIQEVDRVLATSPLSEDYKLEKQRGKIEEEARLIYVGLTRAKRGLYLSCHRSELTRYHRPRQTEAAQAYLILSELLSAMPLVSTLAEVTSHD